MTTNGRGMGKCQNNHAGSYGFPARPDSPYGFCPQCGKPMVWQCASCEASLPEENSELIAARFCRSCGSPYFPETSPP